MEEDVCFRVLERRFGSFLSTLEFVFSLLLSLSTEINGRKV